MDSDAVIMESTEGREEDLRAGGAGRCAAGVDAGIGAPFVVDEVVSGRVGGCVEVSDECSLGQEGGFVTINRVCTTPDWAEEFRVHVVDKVSWVGERVV